jgi:hypothetical protein
MTIRMELKGVPQALAALSELPRRVGFRHLRIALNAGGGILKQSAMSHAPSKTGLLRKSIGVKVKIPDASFNVKHHGKAAYIVIGPRRGFVRASINNAGAAKWLSVLGGGRVNTRNPARYAHLVHGGTKLHQVSVKRARVLSDGLNTFGRRAMVRAKPNQFLQRAVASSGAAAQAKIISKLHEGIMSEARQLANGR